MGKVLFGAYIFTFSFSRQFFIFSLTINLIILDFIFKFALDFVQMLFILFRLVFWGLSAWRYLLDFFKFFVLAQSVFFDLEKMSPFPITRFLRSIESKQTHLFGYKWPVSCVISLGNFDEGSSFLFCPFVIYLSLNYLLFLIFRLFCNSIKQFLVVLLRLNYNRPIIWLIDKYMGSSTKGD